MDGRRCRHHGNFKGDIIGFDANAMECIALTDPDTFVQLPWD